MKPFFYPIPFIYFNIHIQGAKPTLDEPIPTRYLHEAIKIRTYVLNQKTKAKVVRKKAADQKKRLSKMQEVLRETNLEIKHLRFLIYQKGKNMFLRRPDSSRNQRSHQNNLGHGRQGGSNAELALVGS